MTACETEMYRCHNYNQHLPDGKKNFDACTKAVSDKYSARESVAHLLADDKNQSSGMVHVKLTRELSAEVKQSIRHSTHNCFTLCFAVFSYSLRTPVR